MKKYILFLVLLLLFMLTISVVAQGKYTYTNDKYNYSFDADPLRKNYIYEYDENTTYYHPSKYGASIVYTIDDYFVEDNINRNELNIGTSYYPLENIINKHYQIIDEYVGDFDVISNEISTISSLPASYIVYGSIIDEDTYITHSYLTVKDGYVYLIEGLCMSEHHKKRAVDIQSFLSSFFIHSTDGATPISLVINANNAGNDKMAFYILYSVVALIFIFSGVLFIRGRKKKINSFADVDYNNINIHKLNKLITDPHISITSKRLILVNYMLLRDDEFFNDTVHRAVTLNIEKEKRESEYRKNTQILLMNNDSYLSMPKLKYDSENAKEMNRRMQTDDFPTKKERRKFK